MGINRDTEKNDKYTDKLVKILPAELTAIYFLLRTLASNDSDLSLYLIILSFLLCVCFYLISPKIIDMNTPKNRVLYCITFLIWVATIDQYRIATDVLFLHENSIALFAFLSSGIAAIWSFLVPHLMNQKQE